MIAQLLCYVVVERPAPDGSGLQLVTELSSYGVNPEHVAWIAPDEQTPQRPVIDYPPERSVVMQTTGERHQVAGSVRDTVMMLAAAEHATSIATELEQIATALVRVANAIEMAGPTP